jgi:preprotein translocase subunit YajC
MSFLLLRRRLEKDRAMRYLMRWTVVLMLLTCALPLLRADDKKPSADPKPGAEQKKPDAKAGDQKEGPKQEAGDGSKAATDKAQDQQSGAPGAQPERSPFGQILPLLPLLLLLFYIIVLRPQSRRLDAERQQLKALKKGDKVLTRSGIYGTIVGVSENEDEITLKVDDNTRLRMTKDSIVRNLRAEEEAKAAKEKPKEGAA